MKKLIPAILVSAFFTTVACTPPAPVVPVSDRPQRIISLAPSITETLYAVGAGDRVVGVTLFCNWPPEAVGKPLIGEFVRINFEKLLWLKPDLVIASSDAPSETVDHSLNQYGIPKLVVSANTVPEVIDLIRLIGNTVGNGARADLVADDLEKRTRAVEEKLKGASPVKAILVFGHEPLILAGPGIFADDLIKRGGGINLAGNSRIKYPKYSIERIIYEGPEVIIEASSGMSYPSPETDAIRAFWGQWPDIPAVKNDRVIIVNSDLVTRPGPRIVDGLEDVAEALHPEKMKGLSK